MTLGSPSVRVFFKAFKNSIAQKDAPTLKNVSRTPKQGSRYIFCSVLLHKKHSN
ncbi:hypothetical protein BC624_11013 [Flavobacterium granuli]|uniref:Uncharacterized protein n=1 Tax=Flavobacterium granuli TaxID=280093 RepID=A0A1M5SI47_9FLAO|nr:hypothetical protein BC624_11013 [Flavobacterium granuli]SHH38224.1 hypothetical protein SAMN05443373_11212 [Flavobacterium granuli]